MTTNPQNINSQTIKAWAKALGFQQLGITDTKLDTYAKQLQHWLEKNYHGEMSYMARNLDKRCHPEKLLPGTKSIIVVGIDYLPPKPQFSFLKNPIKAFISRYAVGRDYHKLIRKRLQQLATKVETEVGPFGYRAFVDSAPVLERALAEKSGMGWIGKNTMLINKQAGSWFFLGELFTDIPLPVDTTASEHCGSCTACLDVCPTNAFVKPNLLDATRCISYLTIELRTSIPEQFRKPMGNRIFGCDDCQLVCPWNKFSNPATEDDFKPRHNFDNSDLVDLFAWSEQEFMERTAGSPIRRIGYECWLRNIAVALGNAPSTDEVISALAARKNQTSALVREHVEWALSQHSNVDKMLPVIP